VSSSTKLRIKTPRWAKPLIGPRRYKFIKGGRGSGKSHERAESAIEALIINPNCSLVCIREIQQSLRYSAKRLIEKKIRTLKVAHLFEVQDNVIKCRGGAGIIIFQGMQDHNAESIKSLEDFDIAWVEEAQSLSHRSIALLLPTIRSANSEIWFTWNPDQPTDAVQEFSDRMEESDPEGRKHVTIHVNIDDNPFAPDTLQEERDNHRQTRPDDYDHVWGGGFNFRNEAIVFAGKTKVMAFEPQPHWDGPYHGLDFGFANDPTAGVRVWIGDNMLHIEKEFGGVALELDDTARLAKNEIPGIEDYEVQADSARPESISYLKRHGLPRIKAVKKWPGSIKDGIDFLRNFDIIVIHEDCKQMQYEARHYRYKVDRKSDQVTPTLVDKDNHYWDAVRYALGNIIRRPKKKTRIL